MRLLIPPLGTELELTEPWTFTLHGEHRNDKLAEKLRIAWTETIGQHPNGYRKVDRHAEVTLPAGTVLRVDRIYIRSGAGDFDSVTFRLNPRRRKVLTGRFWAKLADVNRLEFQLARVDAIDDLLARLGSITDQPE